MFGGHTRNFINLVEEILVCINYERQVRQRRQSGTIELVFGKMRLNEKIFVAVVAFYAFSTRDKNLKMRKTSKFRALLLLLRESSKVNVGLQLDAIWW